MSTGGVKVFGVGWAKTGTTTLGECLRILGYDHQSQRLNLVGARASTIVSAARHKESFEDWPWLLHFRELDEAYPNSLFILTRRDSDRWLASYKNMISKQTPSKRMNAIRRKLYGLPFPDVTDLQLTARYMRHNIDVIEHFRDRWNLLVVDWEQGDGWTELCTFLGHDNPPVPFPHKNRGVYS